MIEHSAYNRKGLETALKALRLTSNATFRVVSEDRATVSDGKGREHPIAVRSRHRPLSVLIPGKEYIVRDVLDLFEVTISGEGPGSSARPLEVKANGFTVKQILLSRDGFEIARGRWDSDEQSPCTDIACRWRGTYGTQQWVSLPVDAFSIQYGDFNEDGVGAFKFNLQFLSEKFPKDC